MSLKPILARLAAAERLNEAASEEAFGIIMEGEATPAQIAGLLMAMRVRGETVPEMTGAVRPVVSLADVHHALRRFVEALPRDCTFSLVALAF